MPGLPSLPGMPKPLSPCTEIKYAIKFVLNSHVTGRVVLTCNKKNKDWYWFFGTINNQLHILSSHN